jgi:uncharacterized protein YdhG (YjbR/CyaY superfamily)
MQSKAKTVDEYLEEVPTERKEALTQLRDLCRSALKGFDETMDYGMPGYGRNGAVEVGFASQKNYISLYILKQEVMDAYKAQLSGKGVSFGKGCIRYSRPERIDFELVEAMLVASEKSDAPIC